MKESVAVSEYNGHTLRVDEFDLDDDRRTRIVRGDLIPGGTKQIVIERILKGGMEYVYAAPAQGHAQIALTLACNRLGSKTTIFIAKRNELHPRTKAAKRAGAKIVEVPGGYLTVVTARAREYVAHRKNTALIPSGVKSPEFHDEMVLLAKSLHIRPRQVWCIASTGALATALHAAWPKAEFCIVRAGMKCQLDFEHRYFEAPEAFNRPTKLRPPFPSCEYYDAKAWQFMLKHAEDGAVFWNVAE